MIRYCFLLIIFSSTIVCADELKPFTTDGCSVFPDGSIQHQSLWVNCCIRHDLAYWKGGTNQQRLEADESLASCVAEVGEPEIAKLMLAGVRVGGSPYFPTFYRWGYGWSYPRSYQALSESEKQQVKNRIKMFKVIIDSISDELKLTDHLQ
jgi:hypothetical protein